MKELFKQPVFRKGNMIKGYFCPECYNIKEIHAHFPFIQRGTEQFSEWGTKHFYINQTETMDEEDYGEEDTDYDDKDYGDTDIGSIDYDPPTLECPKCKCAMEYGRITKKMKLLGII